MFRCKTLIDRHRIFFDGFLVITYPYQLLAVGTKHHRTVVRELFLIHPVGNTIDNLVLLSVFRHLTLCIVIKQFDKKDIIVTNEGNHRTVRREQGSLLGTVLRQRYQFLAGNGINIIVSCERMTIDTLCVRLYQYPFAVRTHDISIDSLKFGTRSVCHIKQFLCLFTCLKGITGNTFGILTQLGITLSIFRRD